MKSEEFPNFELKTNDSEKGIWFSGVEKFNDGSGLHCTLVVASNGFLCKRSFFFDFASDILASLEKMVLGKPCKAKLKGQWEEDYLEFELNEMGHLFVRGKIFEHSAEAQQLQFSFRTDQTVLPSLLSYLGSLKDA